MGNAKADAEPCCPKFEPSLWEDMSLKRKLNFSTVDW